MAVKITGMDKLLGELESRYGQLDVQKVSDKALLAGAKVFVKELQSQVKTFSDGKGYSEGHTYDEITITGPMWEAKKRIVKIHWRGPYERYRIIHLNEWGTVQNPNPRGKGAIARAMKNAETAYRNEIKKAIREGL